VFSVGTTPWLYNEDPRAARGEIKEFLEMADNCGLAVQLSSEREAEKRWRYNCVSGVEFCTGGFDKRT
jgi:hypothetical protein